MYILSIYSHLFSLRNLLMLLWKRTPMFLLLCSVWLKDSLCAKAVHLESVMSTHLTPGTASGSEAWITSAILEAINELKSSLSPTSNELTLHFAAIMLLKFNPLMDSEKDLAYPIVPNASIPPSSGKTVWDSLESFGIQLLGIGSKLSFTLTIL